MPGGVHVELLSLGPKVGIGFWPQIRIHGSYGTETEEKKRLLYFLFILFGWFGAKVNMSSGRLCTYIKKRELKNRMQPCIN